MRCWLVGEPFGRPDFARDVRLKCGYFWVPVVWDEVDVKEIKVGQEVWAVLVDCPWDMTILTSAGMRQRSRSNSV